jgi:ubiquinone/menaquinone biosynthesis C-methylase UbiE
MTQSPSDDLSNSTGWRRIDSSGDRAAPAEYLDAVRSVDAARRFKQESISLLNLKPGYSALDVGCGTGEDVISIGSIVGRKGRSVGVDISEIMISEARRRAGERRATNVEFAVQNAESLEYAEVSFEGCRADRVLQHLEHPKKALGEFVRVTKRGGRVVVVDTDWDTLVVDSRFKDVTRHVIRAGTDRMNKNGWCGRQLYGMFKEAGLKDISVEPFAGAFTDYTMADQVLSLCFRADSAEHAGLISTEEKARWLSDLQKRQALGRFFASLTVFVVGATKL